MKYSNPTTQQGMIELMRNLTKADEHTLPETTARAFLNVALDEYSDLALSVNPDWQFDDGKWGDIPISTIDIASGKYDYKFNPSFLYIRRIEATDENDLNYDLTQVYEKELPNITEKHKTNGKPSYFYMRGEYINLYPTPNYNKDEGLIIHYERSIRHFDGGSEQRPGIPSIHHPFVVYKASLTYALKEGLSSAKAISQLVEKEEVNVKRFFNHKNRGKRPTLSTVTISSE